MQGSVANDQSFCLKKSHGLEAIKLDGPWANVRPSVGIHVALLRPTTFISRYSTSDRGGG